MQQTEFCQNVGMYIYKGEKKSYLTFEMSKMKSW